MHNPKDTFTNVRFLLANGMGKDLPSNENKLSNIATKAINFLLFASLVLGTIYVFNLLF